jgi:hypothetical protein
MTVRKALLAFAACSATVGAAVADDFKAGVITIDDPWARATIGDAKSTAAYMKISNGGDAPDRLTAVKTDAADHVMLHESRLEGDVMKMVHLDGGIEIPAHGSTELKPLGLHVMVTGLEASLKNGDTLPLTLVFAKQGEVEIQAKVGQPK